MSTVGTPQSGRAGPRLYLGIGFASLLERAFGRLTLVFMVRRLTCRSARGLVPGKALLVDSRRDFIFIIP